MSKNNNTLYLPAKVDNESKSVVDPNKIIKGTFYDGSYYNALGNRINEPVSGKIVGFLPHSTNVLIDPFDLFVSEKSSTMGKVNSLFIKLYKLDIKYKINLITPFNVSTYYGFYLSFLSRLLLLFIFTIIFLIDACFLDYSIFNFVAYLLSKQGESPIDSY